MKLSLSFIVFIFVYQCYAQKSDFSHINFEKADSIALIYKGEGLDNLPLLSYKLSHHLTTDAERFRAIYKWVCENIANDYGLYLKNKNKRHRFVNDSVKFENWNSEFRKTLFQRLLKKKRTICTGYAYLVKILADLANIECEIVQGYGRVSTTRIEDLELPNHSWNAVKLNNKWYLCDPTWASGIPNVETNKFQFQYNDGFFLANPKLFAVNHFPVDSKWWLFEENIPTFKSFISSPIIYGKAYANLVHHIAPTQMHQTIKKFEIINFEYQLIETIKPADISLLVDNGFNHWKSKPQSIAIKDNTLSIQHQFKTSGFYDVHLYIGNDLISTYTFKVTR